MQSGEKKSPLLRYEQYDPAAEANMWKTGLQLCEQQQQGGGGRRVGGGGASLRFVSPGDLWHKAFDFYQGIRE